MIPGPRISAESGMQGQDTEANARDDASNLLHKTVKSRFRIAVASE